MTYGYCRISTKKQNIERQERNIKETYPEALIRKEVYTGTKSDRKEWNKLLRALKPSDTVVFDSVSRMSRNAEEGFETYERLYNAGINLIFLKEPHINTDTYKQAIENQLQIAINSGDNATDELMQSIIAALNKYILALAKKQIYLAFEQSEKEVTDLHQRTKEGIQTARLNGKQIGQKPGVKLTTKKSIAAKKEILKHSKDFSGTLSDIDTMKIDRGDNITSYFEIFDNDGVNGPKAKRSDVFHFTIPSTAALDSVANSTENQILEQLSNRSDDIQKIRKDIDDMLRELMSKKELDWNDKEKIKELIEKQKEIQEEWDKIQEEQKELSNFMKDNDIYSEEIIKKQEEINKLFEEVIPDEMKKLIEEIEKIAAIFLSALSHLSPLSALSHLSALSPLSPQNYP